MSMLNNINVLLNSNTYKPKTKTELRPGTEEFKMTDIASIDLSRFKYALQHFSQCGEVFIRSSNLNKQIIIQDPKQYHRNPLGGLNYHQYYIDYSPLWKNYPRRYNSLMFLAYNMHDHSSYPTENYYGKYTYYVFPENDSKIGVSPTADFIYSFNENAEMEDLYDLNANIRRMYIEIMGEDLKNPESYEDWSNKLDTMTERFNAIEKSNGPQEFRSIWTLAACLNIDSDKFIKSILRPGLLKDMLEGFTSPGNNGFYYMLCNEDDLDGGFDLRKECWTDGTCLLIRSVVFDQLDKHGNIFEIIRQL